MLDKTRLERCARMMFEDSRRGAQLFTQWYSLPEAKRVEWRKKALEVEHAIQAGIAAKEAAKD